MTEIATIDWFGSWGTSVFSENTAIFSLFGLRHLTHKDLVNKISGERHELGS